MKVNNDLKYNTSNENFSNGFNNSSTTTRKKTSNWSKLKTRYVII